MGEYFRVTILILNKREEATRTTLVAVFMRNILKHENVIIDNVNYTFTIIWETKCIQFYIQLYCEN